MPNHQALIDSGKPTTPTKSQYKGEVSSYYKTRDGIDGKYQQPVTSEVIQFAGFLSDYDPSLIFTLTYDNEKSVSYLKVLKIHRKDDSQRGYSFAEEMDKKDLIETVKTNMMENGLNKKAPVSNDNYSVTVNTEKQQMKISKRGQATVAMKTPNLKSNSGVNIGSAKSGPGSPRSAFGDGGEIQEGTDTNF